MRGLITTQVGDILGLLEEILDGNKEGERELAQKKEEIMEFIQSKKYITADKNDPPALINSKHLKEVIAFFNARIN